MNSSTSSQARANALDAIKNYRVSELQALLDYANVTRQGNKRDLLQRCKILINTNFTPQLANKIHQINTTRSRSSRSLQVSSTTPSSAAAAARHQPIVLPQTPPLEVLPPANHVQFVHLPFFEKMRTIECSNMPIDWQAFSPLRFILNETDIDLIRKNSAKVFLRIAPTILNERHNDVLPPYLFVQCNNQPVINNNISKQIGASAHSILFPTDITDKIILKPNSTNTLSFTWIQSPMTMSFKNLPKAYTLAVHLVHCVSLETLFDSILKRERYSNKTDQDDSDIEIEDLGLMTTQHRVSLICPITQSIITQPAKSSLCSHMTCFDLRAFLQMNERRLQWTCPICKKSASFDSLRIDEHLQTILSNVPPNCSTVEINSPTNCQYIFDNIKQEKVDVHENSHSDKHQDIDSSHNSSTKSRRQSNESDCIVLSSGSESEDENDLPEQDDDDNNHEEDEMEEDRENLHLQQLITSLSQSSSAHSSPSPVISTNNDESNWEDFAQVVDDQLSDTNEKYSNRKRTNSSTTSVLSSSSRSRSRSPSTSSSSTCNTKHRRAKRSKRSSSQTSDIEIITLSSTDNSDNDDQVS